MHARPALTRRLAAVLTMVAGFAAALGSSGDGRAMAQPQSDPSVVVRAVYGDLEYLWAWNLQQYGYAYSRPAIRYYGYTVSGQVVTLPTRCGTGNWSYGQYCALDGVLGLRWPDLTTSLQRFGDGTSALWLAHEFAHHVQAISREDSTGRARELEADCMAGIFFGVEVGWGRNLDQQDANEAWTQLSSQPTSPTHGTGAERAAAFALGYQQRSWRTCDASY